MMMKDVVSNYNFFYHQKHNYAMALPLGLTSPLCIHNCFIFQIGYSFASFIILFVPENDNNHPIGNGVNV